MKDKKQTVSKVEPTAVASKASTVPSTAKALTPSLSTFSPLASTAPSAASKTPPSSKKKVITAVPDQVEMRLLKVGQCPSMSGKSDLTYHLGCRVDALTPADIQFRVVANSGGGFFSDEWVPLAAIKKAISKAIAGELTSFNLYSLFEGKSINTPAFLFAVLKQEGLIQPSKAKPRCYETCEAKDLFTEINALIAKSSPVTDSSSSESRMSVQKATKQARTVKPSKIAHSATRKAVREGDPVVPLHDSQTQKE